MTSPLLTIRDLTKTWRNNGRTVDALRDISLDVEEGQFVMIAGPSGCGKSTLLSIVGGLEEPTAGSVTIDGHAVTSPGRDRGLLFQEPALFPWLTVLGNVMFGLTGSERESEARRFLRMVHLEQFESAMPHELSGGMKHRVALARALAPNPQLLLVDEPFSSLDTPTRHHLYRELPEVVAQTRRTVLAVTHDMYEAACLGDRVVILSARPGRIIREVRIELPRPRDPNDPEVLKLAHLLLEAITP